VGSEGTYEVGVFRQLDGGFPSLRDSGHTAVEGHDVVLLPNLSMANLEPGRYWLGLRQDESDWAFYRLVVE
jgi:hypothetical protein